MQTWAKLLLFGLTLTFLPGVIVADDVDSILKRWSQHAAERRTMALHGTARLYTYDSVLQTETRRHVEFWSDGKDHRQIDFTPIAVKTVDPLRTCEIVYAFESIEDLPLDAPILRNPESRPWP